MKIIKIDNCINCPYSIKECDEGGWDGYTNVYCNKNNDKFLGETKTRWYGNGYSQIDPPDDCPLEDDNNEYE